MNGKRMLCALLLAALLLGTALPALALENGQLLVVANCKKAALRSGDSAKARRLAKLPAGALVVYGGLTRGGYRLVRWGSQWGYIGEGCLETAHRALRTRKKVWLRAAPSGSGSKLKKLKKGATVLAVSEGENGWFYVCCDGAYGYVSAKALRAAAPKQGRKGMAVADASIRLDSGKTLRVPALTVLRCFGGDGSGREYVCVNGTYGFIASDKVYIPGKRR